MQRYHSHLAAASTLAAAQGSGFYLGAGVGQSNTKFKSTDWTVGSPLIGESKTHAAALVGVGAEYVVMKNIRVEYENYGRFGDSNDTGRTNADVWSIGASYKF